MAKDKVGCAVIIGRRKLVTIGNWESLTGAIELRRYDTPGRHDYVLSVIYIYTGKIDAGTAYRNTATSVVIDDTSKWQADDLFAVKEAIEHCEKLEQNMLHEYAIAWSADKLPKNAPTPGDVELWLKEQGSR